MRLCVPPFCLTGPFCVNTNACRPPERPALDPERQYSEKLCGYAIQQAKLAGDGNLGEFSSDNGILEVIASFVEPEQQVETFFSNNEVFCHLVIYEI